MNNRRLLARIEKIEALLAPHGMTAEAPIDVSETLAIIASIRPDMMRLSEIDQKRWFCPDDPRSILSAEEIEEEAKIKPRVLEKCTGLGFPKGYGVREYRKDGIRLNLFSETEEAPGFIRLSACEQAEKAIIRARRELIFEQGPHYRAFLRADEIREGKDFLERPTTLWETHQLDHLQVLYPEEPLDDEEIAALDYGSRMLYEFGMNAKETTVGWVPSPQARLDEWHARKGEDPRLFKTFASWQQYPCWPDMLFRQNQQLAEMGFEPDTTSIYARAAYKELEEKNRGA